MSVGAQRHSGGTVIFTLIAYNELEEDRLHGNLLGVRLISKYVLTYLVSDVGNPSSGLIP